ncbi:MAG: SDR family oxidoreductase [Acidobacteriota bacterium]|nr:MAG: SDR family oxidoreductase [Acidobacteriota bacterium]
MGRLDGKVAVVTGATSGMGRAISVRFAQEGASVVMNGRDAERGREVLKEIESFGGRAVFCTGDVGQLETNYELVDTAATSFGGLHILVPCAGMLGLGSVTGVSIETWEEAIATNLTAVFLLLRFGIPEISKGGGGSIVVIGSIAAFKGFPNHAAYCATKGALVPFVRQVAIDYAPAIRANLLCPGPVDTPLIWSSAAAFPDPEKAVSDVAERTLLKRLGTPVDIASAAVFLASEESSWITGTSLTIDGGILTT